MLESLIHWYQQNKRDLPWRHTRDPYRVMVSEFMLVQTTVATVLRRYEQFLKSFPTLPVLARSPVWKVKKAWVGLGYNSRAVNLWRACQAIEKLGRFPQNPVELNKLPGFGSYLSRAVSSIAFDTKAPVMDTNVRRVLLRIFNSDEPGILEALLRDSAIPSSVFNQAFMELGALICKARDPKCHGCPVYAFCATRGEHVHDRKPVKNQRLELLLSIYRDAQNRILAVRRGHQELFLKNSWGLPVLLLQSCPNRTLDKTYNHSIMNWRLHVHVKNFKFQISNFKFQQEVRWIPEKKLGKYLFSSLWWKALRLSAISASGFLLLLLQNVANAAQGLPSEIKTIQQGIPIGTQATSRDQKLTLTLKARFQHYNSKPAHPRDVYDPDIQSPKSVKFLSDGSKVYVNSLEGHATVVYDPRQLKKIATIKHRFNAQNRELISSQKPFDYEFLVEPSQGDVNTFLGKPVEMALSHWGHYLWVSYYRRHYDAYSLNPSAVAVIDTASDQIVEVLPSGPIPKFLAVSLDNRWIAFVHWGDNTVGFVDIASKQTGFHLSHLVTVPPRLELSSVKEDSTVTPIDRDKECGWCLRGAVFTLDSKHLLVGRLSGGGVAVIDVDSRRYLGTVWGMKPTPRHLALSPDGRWVYMSSNVGGYVSKFKTQDFIDQAGNKDAKIIPIAQTHVGYGARTIELSPDGRWVYAAVNGESKLVVLQAVDLKEVSAIAVDSFPVGLAVSPDSRQVWVTSQGRSLQGGNSVCIYEVNE